MLSSPLVPNDPSLSLLHRWVWGNLKNGMHLPVGGSVFTSELLTKLHLDFDAFPKFADADALNAIYAQRKEVFATWYASLPESLRELVDPHTYFTLIAVQNGMEQRLGIISDTDPVNKLMRDTKYRDTIPNLSDFRDGTAFCAERAALGHWMLQAVGIPSAYMSGVSFHEDIQDGADHSWIVLYPDTEQSMIFDIARPEDNRLPNLYKSEAPFSQYIFEDKDNAFVETKKLLTSTTRYFGVSDHPNMTDESANIVKGQVNTLLAPLG